jgi:hypothetical protein
MQIKPRYKGYDIPSAAGSWMRTLIQLSVHSPSSLTFAFDLTRQAQGWCGYISLAFCSVLSLMPSYRLSAVKNSDSSAISISTGSTSFHTLSWLLATESCSFFLITFASLAMDAESDTSTKSIFLPGRGPEKSFLTNEYQMVAVDIADEKLLFVAGGRLAHIRCPTRGFLQTQHHCIPFCLRGRYNIATLSASTSRLAGISIVSITFALLVALLTVTSSASWSVMNR